jgi:Domain of unknown function (DUF4386)
MELTPRSARRLAHAAGAMYLAIIVLGAFGELAVRGALVVPGDAAATAARIVPSQGLWRAGIAGDLLMHVLDVPVIVILYLLLRPAGRGVAITATVFNVVQTAVLAANKLNLLLPLWLLGVGGGGALQAAFSKAQREAMAMLAINAHGHVFGIGLIFFGVACLLRGWLIVQGVGLPRVLGVLLALAGVSYLVNSFALLLAPALASALFPAVLLPAFVGELALSLWLLVKGIDVSHEGAAASAARRATA